MSKDEFLKSVLYPVVRVRAPKGTGSGTIIYSQKVGKNFETYVLTNHHVIQSAIKVQQKYDSFVGQNTPQETRMTVQVEQFRYPSGSRLEGTFAIAADIVAYSEAQDLALLQLRSETEADYVAKMPNDEYEDDLQLADEVFAVGAALAHAPIITSGRINGMSDEIDDLPYWLSDAQIIFGNSGGSVFHGGDYTFIGVPSRVALAQVGWSVSPVSHLGWFIPFVTVYDFFDTNYYSFIYDAELDPAECHIAREEAQEQLSRMADIVAVRSRENLKRAKNTSQYYDSGDESDEVQE
jgi:S1-C subfamily serine protease